MTRGRTARERQHIRTIKRRALFLVNIVIQQAERGRKAEGPVIELDALRWALSVLDEGGDRSVQDAITSAFALLPRPSEYPELEAQIDAALGVQVRTGTGG